MLVLVKNLGIRALKGITTDTAVFVPGDASAPLADSALRALAAVAGQEVTYSCVPPGSGARIAYILSRLCKPSTRCGPGILSSK